MQEAIEVARAAPLDVVVGGSPYFVEKSLDRQWLKQPGQ
jgi:hypothetical protein